MLKGSTTARRKRWRPVGWCMPPTFSCRVYEATVPLVCGGCGRPIQVSEQFTRHVQAGTERHFGVFCGTCRPFTVLADG